MPLKSVRLPLIHLIGITTFLMIPFVFRPFPSNGINRELLGYVLMVGFFYLNYYVLLPRYYFSEKYLLLIVAILGCFALIILLPHFLFPFKDPEGFRPPDMHFEDDLRHQPQHHLLHIILGEIGHNLFLFFMVVFVSIALLINNRLKVAERQRIETELSYLKAQINPHFLFNTLNSIYSLAIQNRSDDTADAVVKLSGMMRYVLHDTEHDFVSLEKELEYISDFIDLQKLRWENEINIDYQTNGNPFGWKIAPVILQPFIENAIKYGINPDITNSQVTIRIEIEQTHLRMTVKNTKVRQQNEFISEGGIGIGNTTRRLEILYPDEYSLTQKEDDKTYEITLILNKK